MTITTVFCGGVHGVGKSSMFSRVASQRGITHLSASSLIKAVKADAVLHDSKVALDVAGNQDLLVQGYRRAVSGQKGLILLDGHFTLINKEGLVTDVPLSTFTNLHLQTLACLTDAPPKIHERLLFRDGRAPSIEEINHHQERELAAAYAVARYLGIELREIRSGDDDTLNDVITRTEKSTSDFHNR